MHVEPTEGKVAAGAGCSAAAVSALWRPSGGMSPRPFGRNRARQPHPADPPAPSSSCLFRHFSTRQAVFQVQQHTRTNLASLKTDDLSMRGQRTFCQDTLEGAQHAVRVVARCRFQHLLPPAMNIRTLEEGRHSRALAVSVPSAPQDN